MSCNSAIYTSNQTNQVVTTTAGTFVQVPFGSILRRFGRNVNLDGGAINLFGSGYYDVECSLTVTPTDAGPITARILQDGMLTGIEGTTTGTAAAPITLPLSSGLVRNCGCDCSTSLTLWIDAPCTITNCGCVVEKI